MKLGDHLAPGKEREVREAAARVSALRGRLDRIYGGSSGDDTKELYQELVELGDVGIIAVNLFRACKTNERAKVYRGGGYRQESYSRKSWSLENLSKVLAAKADEIGLKWGWGRDDAQPRFPEVLYIELPTGQVSFHNPTRFEGPNFAGEWDGSREQASERILRWIADLQDAAS